VLAPHFKSGWKDVSNPAGTGDPADRAERVPAAVHRALGNQRRAHPERRETPRRSSTTCRARGSRPRPSRSPGQDATLTGLQNILTGYQCGYRAYKPIYLEAQATAALAMYVSRRPQASG